MKIKPWIENNNVMIAFYITVLAGLFWVFNIYATGKSTAEHQEKHCIKIDNLEVRMYEREKFDAMLATKQDVMLMINGIDPNKIPIDNKYLSNTRSVNKLTEADHADIKKYIEELTYNK